MNLGKAMGLGEYYLRSAIRLLESADDSTVEYGRGFLEAAKMQVARIRLYFMKKETAPSREISNWLYDFNERRREARQITKLQSVAT